MKILIFILIFYISCFSAIKPDWVSKFGISSKFPEEIYFTGFGVSNDKKISQNEKFQQAKMFAQNALIQTIQVKVSSENVASIIEKSVNGKIVLTNEVNSTIVSKTNLNVEGIKYEVFNDEKTKCIYVLAILNKLTSAMLYKKRFERNIIELKQIYRQVDTLLKQNDIAAAQLAFSDCEKKCFKIEEVILILSHLDEGFIDIEKIKIYLTIKDALYQLNSLKDKHDIYFGGHKQLQSAEKRFEQIKQVVPTELLSQLFIIYYEDCFICMLDLNTSYKTAEEILNNCKENFKTTFGIEDKYMNISIDLKVDKPENNDYDQYRIIDTSEIQENMKSMFFKYLNNTKYIKIPNELAIMLISLPILNDNCVRISFEEKQNIKENVLQWNEYIEIASKKYNVDKTLIKSVIAQESCGNPDAISRKGAKGLMQLMDETAEKIGVTNSFDPFQNILGGTKYLKLLLEQFNGNEKLAVASYNAGPDKVQLYGGIPPYHETKKYVIKVQKFKKIFKEEI
jgi:hypothetical protein